MSRRFNYQREDAFEWKFKRKPKLRSITEVHDLYLRAMERSAKKSKETCDCIEEIVREIPATGEKNSRNGERFITYFYNDDILYQYTMSYSTSYDSYGTSQDRVKFDEGSIEEIRDKKIHFILNNQKAIELGEKYRRINAANRYLHYTVKHAFEEMVVDKLQEIYKDVKAINLPKVIPVVIDNTKYIFSVDQQSYGTYKKFVLLGELPEDVTLS